MIRYIYQYVESGTYFNYTKVFEEVVSVYDYNLAPRKSIRANFNTSESDNETWTSGNVLLIDTQREKEIYLGTGWPYGTLE
jgi:hypothetical protein